MSKVPEVILRYAGKLAEPGSVREVTLRSTATEEDEPLSSLVLRAIGPMQPGSFLLVSCDDMGAEDLQELQDHLVGALELDEEGTGVGIIVTNFDIECDALSLEEIVSVRDHLTERIEEIAESDTEGGHRDPLTTLREAVDRWASLKELGFEPSCGPLTLRLDDTSDGWAVSYIDPEGRAPSTHHSLTARTLPEAAAIVTARIEQLENIYRNYGERATKP